MSPNCLRDGLTPAEQLAEIRKRLLPIIEQQMNCLREDILPKLKTAGVHLASYDAFSNREKQRLDTYFREKVFPDSDTARGRFDSSVSLHFTAQFEFWFSGPGARRAVAG